MDELRPFDYPALLAELLLEYDELPAPPPEKPLVIYVRLTRTDELFGPLWWGLYGGSDGSLLHALALAYGQAPPSLDILSLDMNKAPYASLMPRFEEPVLVTAHTCEEVAAAYGRTFGLWTRIFGPEEELLPTTYLPRPIHIHESKTYCYHGDFSKDFIRLQWEPRTATWVRWGRTWRETVPEWVRLQIATERAAQTKKPPAT